MTSSEINKMVAVLEEQLLDLEDMNANRQFSKKEIIEAFKNNTSSARANGINVLSTAVKEAAERVEFLNKIEQAFPSESRVSGLKRRFAACGQHLIDMINMMEEWG